MAIAAVYRAGEPKYHAKMHGKVNSTYTVGTVLMAEEAGCTPCRCWDAEKGYEWWVIR